MKEFAGVELIRAAFTLHGFTHTALLSLFLFNLFKLHLIIFVALTCTSYERIFLHHERAIYIVTLSNRTFTKWLVEGIVALEVAATAMILNTIILILNELVFSFSVWMHVIIVVF